MKKLNKVAVLFASAALAAPLTVYAQAKSVDNWRNGDGGRRKYKASQYVDFVIGDQLGDHGLGVGARRRAFVTFDELNLKGSDILGVQLDVEIERLVDLIAEIGVDAGIR